MCKTCRATFLEPAVTASGPDAPPFRLIMRAEAATAALVHDEPRQDIADRLGVDRKTVGRWAQGVARRIRKSAVEQVPPESSKQLFTYRLRSIDVSRLRYLRRVEPERITPYAVDLRDAHRYRMAALGEVSFWLLRHKVEKRATIAKWSSLLADRDTSPALVSAVMREARGKLFRAMPNLRGPG